MKCSFISQIDITGNILERTVAINKKRINEANVMAISANVGV